MSVNLYILGNIIRQNDNEFLEKYEKNNNFTLKVKEKDCILALLSNINKEVSIPRTELLNGFKIGYTIKQIGKEFDLLKVTSDKVLNIELKSSSTIDKIFKQQQQNYYYLNSISNNIEIFTYCLECDQFYKYDGNITKICSTSEVLNVLEDLMFDEVEKDIDSKFSPEEFLISPFNDVEKFLASKYFLTKVQEERKNKFLTSDNNCFIVNGPAGSGKSLFMYDIAKSLMEQDKKVRIIHCGQLNEGHFELINDYDWDIKQAHPTTFNNEASFSELEYVFVDEAQRLIHSQLAELLDYFDKYLFNIVFSFDHKQPLATWDPAEKNEEYLREKIISIHDIKLTDRIRSNSDVNYFVKQAFNFQPNRIKKCENVTIEYIQHEGDIMQYIKDLEVKGWVYLPYTKSRNNITYHKYCSYNEHLNSHRVIGQEFNKVLVILDESFYYNRNNISYKGEQYYLPRQMFYQNITRAKRELKIIVINNYELFVALSKIVMGENPAY